jgi:DNA recombination protein Rad52
MKKDELKKKLNPKDVKSRKKGGTNLSYIEGWKTIDEANAIFDFDGWSRETVYNREITRVDVKVGKGDYAAPGFKVGYEAKVAVTVGDVKRDGTGHGSQTSKDLFDAIEGAAKEAETDAMKRALMTFGNRFGLALYDKTQANVGIDEKTPEEKRADAEKWVNNYMIRYDDCKDAREAMNLKSDESKTLNALGSKHPDLAKKIGEHTTRAGVPSPSQAAAQ